MLSCYPVKWEDKLYNLSSTGETHQPSLYLLIWDKPVEGQPRPRPRLVAKIVFTDKEIEDLDTLQDYTGPYTGGLSTDEFFFGLGSSETGELQTEQEEAGSSHQEDVSTEENPLWSGPTSSSKPDE
ncbi:hypothetical protein V9T40_012706 [Parthenolecanium corni]|uniref:Uncharacterized protein n=1 Tax=Parthenolecanium corni TaxID=536013 RepID=A0AAN9Y0P6_9HEMI